MASPSYLKNYTQFLGDETLAVRSDMEGLKKRLAHITSRLHETSSDEENLSRKIDLLRRTQSTLHERVSFASERLSLYRENFTRFHS